MASVNSRDGRLYFDFRFKGLRCREQTTLPDTATNRKKLETVLKRIDAEIMLGQFDYARYFPNSPMLEKIQRVTKQQALAQAMKVATPTFAEFSRLWFDQMTPSWRQATAESYQFYLEKRLIPYFGEIDVGEISKSDIMQFRAEATKLYNGTLKPKTVNKYIKLLKMILTEAADRYDFTPRHLNIKALKEEKVHIEPFSIEEVNKLINTVRSDWRAYLIVRFFTGLRTGEIDGLKWENVDFERRQILVRETYSKGRFEYTKNDGSQREVDMSNLVYETLLRHLGKNQQSGLVFSTREGAAINNANFLSRVWRPLLALLGIPYRRPYQTRHTAATLWLAAGENPTWIAKQLGHTNTEMLFKVYGRYVPNLTRQDGSAVEKLIASNIQLGQGGFSLKDIQKELQDRAQHSDHLQDHSNETSELDFWTQLLNQSSQSNQTRGVL